MAVVVDGSTVVVVGNYSDADPRRRTLSSHDRQRFWCGTRKVKVFFDERSIKRIAIDVHVMQ